MALSSRGGGASSTSLRKTTMRTLLATFALLLPTALTGASDRVAPGDRSGSAPEYDAPASTYVTYGTSGGWSIVIDAENDAECFVMGRFRTGTTMRFGIDRETRPQSVYIVMSDRRWRGLARNAAYPVRVSFDQAPAIAMTATSGEKDATSLTMRFSDSSTAAAFALARTMIVRREGRVMARMTLGQPIAALAEMGACSKDMTVLMDALRAEGVVEDEPVETKA